MILKDFFQRFPDEEACVSYFVNTRLGVGIKCPRCGCEKYSWLKGRKVFQCEDCGHRISLTKGTVMEQSKRSLYDWFFTAHIMTTFKQVMSAKEIQHQLNLKDYPSVWLMMMKYRDIMGQRDLRYKLSKDLEMDIAFFPTSKTQVTNGIKNTIAQKTSVVVMAESIPVDNILSEYMNQNIDKEAFNKASSLIRKSTSQTVKKVIHYIKMFAVANQRQETIMPIIKKVVEYDSNAVTDGGKGFLRLNELLRCHDIHMETEEGTAEVVSKLLPWVHIVTGECRSGIEAIHRNIDERFLQLYLNEYCWKFNRRFFRDSNVPKYDLFDHLIKIAAQYTSDIKWRDYEDVKNGFNNF